MTSAELRKELSKSLAALDAARRSVVSEKKALAAASGGLEDALQAQKVLQSVAEAVQTATHRKLSAVVTSCLEAVFGEDAYSFKLSFSQKRGRTEAALEFIDGATGNAMDPTSEGCGGQVDVASFALRLIVLKLSQPARRPLLVMDEPMRGVNGEGYQSRVAAMVEAVAEEMGVQMMIASDRDWLKVGKVIEL